MLELQLPLICEQLETLANAAARVTTTQPNAAYAHVEHHPHFNTGPSTAFPHNSPPGQQPISSFNASSQPCTS